MTVSYAVVGASRGIGLEYVRQLAGREDTVVFAVVRNQQKSTHLNSAIRHLKNVHVLEADVVDYPSLARAAKAIAEHTGDSLDYLIHNAARTDPSILYRGYEDYRSMDELDDDFIDAFKVNALGVLHSIAAFVPLLRAGSTRKIIVMGSRGGSAKYTQMSMIPNVVAHAMAKAAAIHATTKWAAKLKDEGFIVVSICPGSVDTTSTMGKSGDPKAVADMESLVIERYKALGQKLEVQ